MDHSYQRLVCVPHSPYASRLPQAELGLVVFPSNQMNLGESVVDGATRLAQELHAPHVERPAKHLPARSRFPTRTQICPSEASATPRPCGDPVSV